MIDRRQVLACGAAALALAPMTARAAPAEVLEARPGSARVVPGEDYPETQVWGFNGAVPGPTVRARQGDTVRRTLVNRLVQPTAVHWHGLRIDNAMDGVPGLTQGVVEPGSEFRYAFTVPDAGTYWYHSHNRSTEQIARGLYGAFIVDEADPPDIDHDITVVLDDWRLGPGAQIIDDFGSAHDFTHAGRIGNVLGAVATPDPGRVKQNDRLRLRLINVATDRVMRVGLHGLAGHVVALDGMPLRAPQVADQVLLGPAQRADFIVDVVERPGTPAMIALHEPDRAYPVIEWPVAGVSARAARAAPAPLPPNPGAYLTEAPQTASVPLLMEGGAMGYLQKAVYEGREMDIRALMQQGQVWALNGVAGLPPEPLATLDIGETLRIPIRNDTAFAHAMHLHGHHFQEVAADGSIGPLRDTILLQRWETREIALRADNPGGWLLHCHMLSHQAAGMTTWIKVNA